MHTRLVILTGVLAICEPFVASVFIFADNNLVPGGAASGLAALVVQLGISGIFIWLYTIERKDRQAAQVAKDELLERVLPLLTLSTTTLKEVQDSMKDTVERGTPDRRDFDTLFRRVELLGTEMGDVLDLMRRSK